MLLSGFFLKKKPPSAKQITLHELENCSSIQGRSAKNRAETTTIEI